MPGGQAVYVLPTGALTFTLAHAEGQPAANNGTTTGFSFALGVFGFTGLNSAALRSIRAKLARVVNQPKSISLYRLHHTSVKHFYV